MAIVHSIGSICSLSLQRQFAISSIDRNVANYCLTTSIFFSFFDSKVDKGTGPFTDEELVSRQPSAKVIQRTLYSEYLKQHVIKLIIDVFLDGIIAYLYQAVSARENDIVLLNMLWLNQHSMELQLEIAEWKVNELRRRLHVFFIWGQYLPLSVVCCSCS